MSHFIAFPPPPPILHVRIAACRSRFYGVLLSASWSFCVVMFDLQYWCTRLWSINVSRTSFYEIQIRPTVPSFGFDSYIMASTLTVFEKYLINFHLEIDFVAYLFVLLVTTTKHCINTVYVLQVTGSKNIKPIKVNHRITVQATIRLISRAYS